MAEKRFSGAKVIETQEVVGSHLSPIIKEVLLMGDKAPLYYRKKKIFIEWYKYGLISAEDANKLLQFHYWDMAFQYIPKKIAELGRASPETIFGVLTHIKAIHKTEDGKTHEEFKCQNVVNKRDDPEKWHEYCRTLCKHWDKKRETFKDTCPLRWEYHDEMMDITAGNAKFPFERIPVDDTIWVETQKNNMFSAIHNAFNVSYPFMGFDDYERIKGERPEKKIIKVIDKELERSLSEVADVKEKATKKLRRLQKPTVKHPKYKGRRFNFE